METVSIRELKQQAGAAFGAFRFHAQLDRALAKTTKTGNPFYELKFADAEEQLVLRVWHNAPMFETCGQLRTGQFYEIAGEFGLGGDGRSIDGRSWTVRALDEAETRSLLGGSAELRQKQDEDYAYLVETCTGLADPRLRALCLAFFDRFGKRLRRTAGARDYHHARRGGLVEHVSQMVRSAVQICVAYPTLNRDLLVTGVLFHDIGKLWENAYPEKGFTMPYTEVSELLGHIALGMEVVNRLWRDLAEKEEHAGWSALEPDSDRVRLHLLHLIVSHHGELAFGSPVVPKTPEAQALHYIDNLDAKMEMFDRGYQVATELGRHVLERVRPLPGRLITPLPRFDGGPTAGSDAEGGPADPESEAESEARPSAEPEPEREGAD